MAKVTFNKKLTQLKSGTFIGCESLTSVRLPSNIYFIEAGTFDGNYLKEVIIETEPGDPVRAPFGFFEGWIANNEDNKVSIKFVKA